MRGRAAGCTRRTVLAWGVAALTTGQSPGTRAAPQRIPEVVVLDAARRRIDRGGAPTDLWCFGGSVPGPVIRAEPGKEVQVRLVNHLGTPISLHWHGMRIANAMDGVAGLTQPPVAPGDAFDYRITPPDSGTFWYHPVAVERPLGPLGGGLHGLLIVEEREPPAVDREFLLAAASFRLDPAGRPVEMGGVGRAMFGIGGRAEAETLTLPRGARVRLRAVNVSPAALLLLGISGAAQSVIAIDSQPCDPFTPARGLIPIGPGARFDVVLELPRSAGALARVTLRDAFDDADDGRTVLELHAGDDMAPERPLPAALPANPLLPRAIALERATRAELLLRPRPPEAARRAGRSTRASGTVLSPHLDPAEPVVSVARGAPVVFALVNPSAWPTSVHIHGHSVRVLHDLDDGWHPYWRDTVLIEPRKTHHVAFVADNPGTWLISAQALGASGSSSAGFACYHVR